jgi:hypothetical protein
MNKDETDLADAYHWALTWISAHSDDRKAREVARVALDKRTVDEPIDATGWAEAAFDDFPGWLHQGYETLDGKWRSELLPGRMVYLNG